MKKYSDYLLICDLDGTLLNEKRELSIENRDALHHFIDEGGEFTVATGRMDKTTVKKFPQLPFTQPGIFYNGALIYDTREEKALFSDFLPKDARELVTQVLSCFPGLGVEIQAKEDVFIIKDHDTIEQQKNREGFTPIYTELSMVPDEWYKILLAGERSVLENAHQWVVSQGTGVHAVFSEEHLVDILKANINKGNAMKHLINMKRLNQRTIIGVGDNNNDIELIAMSHVGMAVGNATDKLKACAKVVLEPNSTPCIPQVLNWLDHSARQRCSE